MTKNELIAKLQSISGNPIVCTHDDEFDISCSVSEVEMTSGKYYNYGNGKINNPIENGIFIRIR